MEQGAIRRAQFLWARHSRKVGSIRCASWSWPPWVRIVLKVLGGGVCRPRADLMFLSHAQGRAGRFVQMQAPARHCCQLRACTATGYRSNWDHIDVLAAAPIMLVIGGWGGPILLPAALQLSDRYT